MGTERSDVATEFYAIMKMETKRRYNVDGNKKTLGKSAGSVHPIELQHYRIILANQEPSYFCI